MTTPTRPPGIDQLAWEALVRTARAHQARHTVFGEIEHSIAVQAVQAWYAKGCPLVEEQATPTPAPWTPPEVGEVVEVLCGEHWGRDLVVTGATTDRLARTGSSEALAEQTEGRWWRRVRR